MNYINILTTVWVGTTLLGGLYLLYIDTKWNWTEEKIKAIATSFGILGTFFGIVLALYSFDTSNISDSIPSLLDGLKTAFSTSIAGLLISLLASFREKFSEDENQTAGDNLDSLDQQILDEIKSLNKNIIGDGESSLNSQIGKLRQDNTDNLKGIKTSFESFAEKMANQNINALTEAIEKVMGEFNTTINDKLGKTFEDFKISVDNLNSWQKEYLIQIESQTKNMEEFRNTTSTMSEDIVSMKDSYMNIGKMNEQFRDMVDQLNEKLREFSGFALSLSRLADDMDGKADAINKEISEIATSAFELINVEIKNSSEALTDNALDIQKQIAGTSQKVSEAVELATKEMDETMNKTLASFGSNLASISSKMAEDFKRIQEMIK